MTDEERDGKCDQAFQLADGRIIRRVKQAISQLSVNPQSEFFLPAREDSPTYERRKKQKAVLLRFFFPVSTKQMYTVDPLLGEKHLFLVRS